MPLKIDIVTIFPTMVQAPLGGRHRGRGDRRAGCVDVRVHDLREHAPDRHRVVDDVPFGGGPGMVLKPEPLFRAVAAIRAERGEPSRDRADVARRTARSRTRTHGG